MTYHFFALSQKAYFYYFSAKIFIPNLVIVLLHKANGFLPNISIFQPLSHPKTMRKGAINLQALLMQRGSPSFFVSLLPFSVRRHLLPSTRGRLPPVVVIFNGPCHLFILPSKKAGGSRVPESYCPLIVFPSSRPFVFFERLSKIGLFTPARVRRKSLKMRKYGRQTSFLT